MTWRTFKWPGDGADGCLPRAPGVYAIYFDGELRYIGQTVDLRNRFSEHRFRYGYAKNIITPWGDVPDTAVIIIKYSLSRRYGDWAMRELRLIRSLRPRYNVNGRGRKLKAA